MMFKAGEWRSLSQIAKSDMIIYLSNNNMIAHMLRIRKKIKK